MREYALQEQKRAEQLDQEDWGHAAPKPLEGAEMLSWDAAIDAPMPRRSGTVRVSLEFAGRGRPTPVDDPSAD